MKKNIHILLGDSVNRLPVGCIFLCGVCSRRDVRGFFVLVIGQYQETLAVRWVVPCVFFFSERGRVESVRVGGCGSDSLGGWIFFRCCWLLGWEVMYKMC